MFPATPEHVARHQVPALRRDLEPAQGQRFIALDAAPVQQDLPEQAWRIDHALLAAIRIAWAARTGESSSMPAAARR
jgi:hypothetical protein